MAQQESLLPLGEPPFDDTEEAAKLLVRYGLEAPLSADGTHSFLKMVSDPVRVLARAREIAAA